MKNRKQIGSGPAVFAMAWVFFAFGMLGCGDDDASPSETEGMDVVISADVEVTPDVETQDMVEETEDMVVNPPDVVSDVATQEDSGPVEDTVFVPEEDVSGEGGDPDIISSPDVGIENPDGDDDMDLLTNAEEAQWGTDPQDSDSDDDGYLDGHEVMEEKDPTDPESVIYIGGWPYNPDKDNVEQGDWNGTVGNGELLPRFKAYDQYGDLVDVYDLMGQGRMVVLDVGTWFCDPCKAMAAYFSTGDVSHMDAFCETVPACWWKESYMEVLDLINTDQIYWITVVFSLGSAVTQEDAAEWHHTFPHDKILVLADSTLVLKNYLDFTAMPHIDVLDENLHFISYNHSGPTGGLNFLIDAF